MNKRLFRHFFDLHDPFFFPSGFLRPMKIQFQQLKPMGKEGIVPRNTQNDPHEIF